MTWYFVAVSRKNKKSAVNMYVASQGQMYCCTIVTPRILAKVAQAGHFYKLSSVAFLSFPGAEKVARSSPYTASHYCITLFCRFGEVVMIVYIFRR